MKFASQRLEWMIQQAQFGQLSFEELFYLMKYYESNGDEENRFDAVIAWNNRPRRESTNVHQFKALLSTVDFTKIPLKTNVDLTANIDDKEFRYVKNAFEVRTLV